MYNLHRGKKRVVVTPQNTDYELEESNPYISHVSRPSGTLISFNSIRIPEDLIVKADAIEKMNCCIRFICLCDVLMSLYYFDVNLILGSVLFIASVNGYISTINYKKSYLACYLGYQYLQVLGRCLNAVYVISYYAYTKDVEIILNGTDNGSVNGTSNNTLTKINTFDLFAFDNMFINIIFSIAMFLMQLFIAYNVQIYYRLLPTNEDIERIQA